MVISRKIAVEVIVLAILTLGLLWQTGWLQLMLTPHVSVETPAGIFNVPTALLQTSENLTIPHVGTIPVISAQEALQELKNGVSPEGTIIMCNCDVISYFVSRCGCVLTVKSITLSYNDVGLYDPHQSLNPVWDFGGTLSDGGAWWDYDVYAWKFANFTEISNAGSSPLTVRFNDTSQDFPKQWLWDFGGGTNSTLQNVTHSYASPGTYNVTLNAWNDRGSDSVTKEIMVRDTENF